MSTLHIADPSARVDLGAFTGRVVRLDEGATMLLRAAGDSSSTRVQAWGQTPFDVLATRSVPGVVQPPEAAVPARELLAALTVGRDVRIDVAAPGAVRWRAELPVRARWQPVAELPADELDRLAERGLGQAAEHSSGHGPRAELLDQTALTAGITAANGGTDANGPSGPVRIPLRCLFALAGIGLLGNAGQAGTPGESAAFDAADGPVVRVRVTDSWLRLDARFGSVVCRRRRSLPLVSAR